MLHHPPLVEAALAAGRSIGYLRNVSDSLGVLLFVLAATVGRGRLLVFGAGTGVATSWITSAMSPNARLIAYEPDPQFSQVTRSVVGEKALVVDDHPRDVLRRGPFSLVFLNLARTTVSPDQLFEELLPGGIVIVGNYGGSGVSGETVDLWRAAKGFNMVEITLSSTEQALLLTRQAV